MRRESAALLFMCASAALIPVGDALAKEIAGVSDIPAGLVAFARFVIGSAIFLPIAFAAGQRPLLTRRFLLAQLLRGICVTGAIFGMVTAVRHAPLADVFGAFFIAPAIAAGLAVLLLGETLARRDLLSLGLGLLGVLLVTRPGGAMNEGLLWALGSGCCYGAFNVATRWAAPLGRPLGQLGGQLVVGAIFTAPFGLPEIGRVGEAPGLLFATALASALANLCLVMAYARERAAVLAPLIYLQLISAAVIGWAGFGDLPDVYAALGLALILFAGLGLRLIGRLKAGGPPAALPPQGR